jgi:signal peptidase I
MSMEDETIESYRVETLPDSVTGDGGPDAQQESRGATRFAIDILETLVLSVLLFLAINAISARIRVDGFSMEPTLQSGEFVIVNKLAYRLGEPQYGDVIVFQYPRDPEQEYIKRIIGLPGDSIRIQNGGVYVNGEMIDEPYIAAAPNYNSTWEVPVDSLFVLGDNRNRSSDSHNWGPVGMEYVIGKAVVIYWPPEEWGLIPHFSTASATPNMYPAP